MVILMENVSKQGNYIQQSNNTKNNKFNSLIFTEDIPHS